MAKKDFFISYTKSDELWAKWIAWQLENAGLSVVIQCWDFTTGNFVDKINDAIINSERYITVISPAYFESDWCKAEWTALFTKDPANKNSILIPIMIKECKLEGLFAPIIYIKLTGLNEDEAADRLLNAIKLPGGKKSKPSFPGTGTAKAAGTKGKPVFPPAFPKNNLPQRNINFTGREEIIENIHKSFESGNYAALTQAITSLGGVGKTQTALEYAYRYAEDYDVIWWINAESFDTLLLGFMEFAYTSGIVDKNVIEQGIIVSSVKDWMTQNSRWLFIFDNAEKPEGLKENLPGKSNGNILITSRYYGWRNYREIGIDVFKPVEATDFLLKSTRIDDTDGANKLAKELGFLPLALEQAAAYILNERIDYKKYIELYYKHTFQVGDNIFSPKDYNSTVAVTWDIAIEKIKNESAIQLLNICSFFSGDSIDRNIFPKCADCLPEPLASGVKDELKYNEIIFELSKYSLIKNQGNCYSIHKLLQEVIRDSHDRKIWLGICLDITQKKFIYNEYVVATWNNFSLLLKHSLSIAGFAEEEGIGLEEAGRIYYEAAVWLEQKALYSESLVLANKAQNIREKIYGKEHQNTASAISIIASIYEHLGDYKKAQEWYWKALKIHEKILSKEHPSIAVDYNNIALVYEDQGDYEKALEWYGKALEIYERVLGKNYPDTATTYNNIAGVYGKLGDYEKAQVWYGKALQVKEKILGKEHPSTATTYNNIAAVYEYQGDYEKALEWFGKALEIKEKILGKEHPSIATTYNNIAMVYMEQSKYDKALEWYHLALTIIIKVLGKEHPNAAVIYNNIAGIYYSIDKYEKALEWYEKALEINEKVFGKNHPNTASNYNSIGLIYKELNKYNDSLISRQLIVPEKGLNKEISSRIQTEESLDMCEKLAIEYYKEGKNEEAEALLEKIFISKEDTDITKILDNLFYDLFSIGEKDLVLKYFKKSNGYFNVINFINSAVRLNKEQEESLRGLALIFHLSIELLMNKLCFDIRNIGTIAHYSDVKSLNYLIECTGINRHVVLRLQNAAYMNDPTEGLILIDFIEKECRGNLLLEEVCKTFRKKTIYEENQCRTYLFSLSQLKDELSMWVSYGDNGEGVCYVFDPSFFDKREKPKFITLNDSIGDKNINYSVSKVEHVYPLYTVCYMDDDTNFADFKTSLIYKDVIEVINAINNINKFYVDIKQEVPKEIINYIAGIIDQTRFLFKTDNYKNEKELRILQFEDINSNNIKLDEKSTPLPALYVEVEDQRKLKFEEIILGPKIQNPEKIIPFLLYTGNVVRRSKNKFR